jgi:PST family polysaccharide transporter
MAYSVVMTLWVLPVVVWAVHGTVISVWDILRALSLPLGSSVVAAGLAIAVQFIYGPMLSRTPRLVCEVTVLLAVYTGVLLVAAGRKSIYLEILTGLRGSLSAKERAWPT